MKLEYPSVDVAVEELRRDLPLLKLSRKRAEADPRASADLKQNMDRVIALLEDPDELRRRLERSKKPDGRVEFSFTPEAEALFRAKFPKGA